MAHHHLTDAERLEIGILLRKGYSFRDIAAARDYSPARYEAKMAEQLPRLTEDLEDPKLKRVIRLFGMEPRCWRWLSNALHLRLQTIVKAFKYAADGSRDYIFEGLVIDELRPLLLTVLSQLDESEQMALIARRPRAEFAETAIGIYGESNSWRGAEAVAANLILPLAGFFTPDHIRDIADIVSRNSQIHDAHGTPGQITQLFEKTARIHPATRAYWEKLAQHQLDVSPRFTQLERAMEGVGMTLPKRRKKKDEDE